jgi:hypothetical protein
MELRELLELGAQKAGNLTALGRQLGLAQQTMDAAKRHKRPLPVAAAVQLADYIGADRIEVIAANELATEKDEKKRAYWAPFVEHARAASVALTLAIATNFATPPPAEAAPMLKVAHERFVLCQIRRLKQRHLFRSLKLVLEAFVAHLSPWATQPEPV